jgi:hypothetical protein
MSSTAELIKTPNVDFPWINGILDRYRAPPTILERVTFPVKTLFHLAAQLTVRYPAVLHYGSDNGNFADLAASEIRLELSDISQIFRTLTGRPVTKPDYHDIPAQDTNAAAFDLAQLARRNLRGFGNVFFFNCAPRKKQRGVEGDNLGEAIYIGILPNGAIIGATGEEPFIHFKYLIETNQLNIYRVNVARDGTQFRSRDYFPWVGELARLYISQPRVNRRWRNDLSLEQRDEILFGLGIVDRFTKLHAETIPELAAIRAVRSDTHGNLKLDVRHTVVADAFRDDPKIVVYANGHILRAELKTDSFDQKPGNTAISNGSSGRWTPDGRPHVHLAPDLLDGFAELFTVDQRARDHLSITDASLKRGADIHLIPAGLFDTVQEVLSKMEREHDDAVVAQAIVQSGLVRGLDSESLRQSFNLGNTIETIIPHIVEIEAAVQRHSPARTVHETGQLRTGIRRTEIQPVGQ